MNAQPEYYANEPRLCRASTPLQLRDAWTSTLCMQPGKPAGRWRRCTWRQRHSKACSLWSRCATLRWVQMSDCRVRSEYRTILITDIEAYGAQERDDAIRSRLRASLRALVHEAFDRTGIELGQSTWQTTGDGLLITVDPAIGKPRILREVVASLSLGLHEYNRPSIPAERLRIRAVLHAADLLVDCDGPLGDQLNLAFRLLDAPALRELLRQASGPMVLCVSDVVYQQVIAQRHEGLEPANFEPVWLESKRIRQLGWVCAPGEQALVARTRLARSTRRQARSTPQSLSTTAAD